MASETVSDPRDSSDPSTLQVLTLFQYPFVHSASTEGVWGGESPEEPLPNP